MSPETIQPAFPSYVLQRDGYRRRRAARQLKGIHGGKTLQYVKLIGGRRVSVDLLLNAVVCRQTGGEWRYQLLRKNSLEASVVGFTGSVLASVPKRELLMAMKIHSGWGADLRDVVMLSEGAKWREVATFASCGHKASVIRQAASAMETIGKKEFPSSLRAEFGLRSHAIPLIKTTLDGLNIVNQKLSTNF